MNGSSRLLSRGWLATIIVVSAIVIDQIIKIWVKTNMTLDDMIAVAGIVISNGIPDVDTLRLPIAKPYKEEVRNGEGMLYDCDFATNAVKLYDFIYE